MLSTLDNASSLDHLGVIFDLEPRDSNTKYSTLRSEYWMTIYDSIWLISFTQAETISSEEETQLILSVYPGSKKNTPFSFTIEKIFPLMVSPINPVIEKSEILSFLGVSFLSPLSVLRRIVDDLGNS